MRKTAEATEQTRRDLLDAALQEFSTRGYEGARMETLAARAGISKGTIYWHFRNKQGIFLALVQEGSSQFEQIIGQAIAQGGTFGEIALRIFVETLLVYERDERFRAIRALVTPELASIAEVASVWQSKQEEVGHTVEQLAGFFQHGINQGEVRADLNCQEAARTFLALQDGLMQLWAVRPFAMEPAARTAANIFVHGIEPTT